MNCYINDNVVIVNNKFEEKIFIYDREKRIEYDINESSFDVLSEIKTNISTIEMLKDTYDSEFIDQLFELNILTTKPQKNINNVKQTKKYNCARIYTEVTDKCNLACQHCYGGFAIDKKNFIDVNLLENTLQEASKIGTYQFDITGGEPLLHPNIEKILKIAYDKGMIVRIFTNLTLCNDKTIAMFLKYGVKEIVTSIDSPIPNLHNKFRGQNGSFEKTISQIHKIQENNIDVAVNTMIGKHNKDYIDEMVDLINNLKVRSVLDVIVPEGRAKNLNEDIIDSAKIIHNIYKKHEQKINEKAIAITCGIGERFIYIKSDGNVYICPSLIGEEYKLGNINDSVTTLWKKMNERFSYLNCNKKTERCKDCNGGCRARALKLNRTINDSDDVFCIINEAGCIV